MHSTPHKAENPEIICIGEALLDRLGPLGGDPALDHPVEDCLGGAPANVACGLARLGTKVAFIGRLGKDEIANQFLSLMRSRGVNLNGLQIDQIRPTRIVLVRRDKDGERSFQGFAGDRGEGFADQALECNAITSVWPLITKNSQWLLLGTIPLAVNAASEALLWTINQACQNNMKIALDINWRPTFWDISKKADSGPGQKALKAIRPVLNEANLLKLAKEEADWFFNTENPQVISRSLPKNPDVVVTDGPRPVRWFIGGFEGSIPVITTRKIVDTTGAGDAFAAGLLHQFLTIEKRMLSTEKVKEMVRFAMACGAIVCMESGGIQPQPTQEEVLAFLATD